MLYVGFIGGGTQPPVDPPPTFTASFTTSCTNLRCTFTNTTVGATSISWTVDGTSAGSATTVVRDFAARTNHTVSLTASNGGPTPSTATTTVACNPKKCQ